MDADIPAARMVPQLILPSRAAIIWLLNWVFMLSFVTSTLGSGTTNWSRDITDGGTLKDYPRETFLILTTAQTDDRLSAGCAYQYFADKGSVVLHGMRNSDGEFAPFVSYQVAVVQGKREWKTIGKSPQTSNPAHVEMGPVNPRIAFDVDVEAFRSSIGRFRWGRVVLENGEAAPFAIDDLLPAGNNPDAAGNFKQSVKDLDPQRFGSTFTLRAVTSFSKQLIGDFYLIRGRNRSSIGLSGRRTVDYDFWPSVKFQVGDSDRNWQTLGRSTEGRVTKSVDVIRPIPLRPLRVRLDAYRSYIGRFKYGKVIFSDGQFSVFEIDNLTPR